MGKGRVAVAVAALTCWAGSASIVVAGFVVRSMGSMQSVEWCRLNTFLVSAGAVLSVAWMIDRFIASPRQAYLLGVEVGERRLARRQGQGPQGPVQLAAVRDARQAPAARRR